MTQFMFGVVKLAPKAFSLNLYYFAYAFVSVDPNIM